MIGDRIGGLFMDMDIIILIINLIIVEGVGGVIIIYLTVGTLHLRNTHPQPTHSPILVHAPPPPSPTSTPTPPPLTTTTPPAPQAQA